MQRSLVLLAAAVLGTSACADANDDLGQIDLSLVGQASSGTTYRLRDAVLTIDGPGGPRTFRTEDDPGRTQINARLQSGGYTLQVASGWHLERVAPGGGQRVAATLLSEHPLPFQVAAGEFTPVVLRFRAGADDVGLGEGDVGISIGVDDVPPGPQEIIVTPNLLSITEGSAAAVGVRLAQPISAPVTVAVSSIGSIAAVSPATLTFTPQNHDVAQVVQVVAAVDDNTVTDSGELILAMPGAVTQMINVAIRDIDSMFIIVDDLDVDLVEGQSRTVGVRLSAQPSSSVSVSLAFDSLLVNATPPTLTFTASNWNVVQTVQLSGQQDADIDDAVTTVDVRSAQMPTTTVSVHIDDDDVQQIVASSTAVAVNRSATQTVGVQLAFRPAANLVVTIASSDASIADATPSSLVFTPTSWSTPQTITIRGVAAGAASIQASAAGIAATSIAVTVQTPPVTSTLGWPIDAGQSVDLSANVLVLFPVDLSEPATLQSLQVLGGQQGPLARLAIYRNAGDRPSTLIVATAASPVLAAPQQTVQPVAATPLAPGRYWLAAVLSGPSVMRRGATSPVPRCTAALSFIAAFPSSAPSSMTCTSQPPLAIAATVQR